VSEETPKARADRELIELLNELRVALPGIQVLFAFLLAVPFQQRFQHVSEFERDTYFVTLCTALISIALLIAPSAFHRLNFRHHDKQRIVSFGNRCVIGGLAALAVALVSVMVLVTDVLFAGAAVIIAPVLSAGLLILLWAVLPLRERARGEERTGVDPPTARTDPPV
jgi:amino acid transporter